VHVAAYLIEHRNQLLVKSNDSNVGNVLELGSGTGVLSIALAPFVQRIVASDHDPALCGRIST
jgi:methylase of polypeptide subunit release factors